MKIDIVCVDTLSKLFEEYFYKTHLISILKQRVVLRTQDIGTCIDEVYYIPATNK